MRSEIWLLEPSLEQDRVEAILGSLAARGIAASTRDLPEGRVLLVPDPPPDLERPAGVLRSASVEVPTASQVTRRNFLDSFAVGIAAASLGTGALFAGMYAVPPPGRSPGVDEMDVGSVAEIEAQGSRLFRFGREPCVVVASGGAFHALSTVCTHLGCLVAWEPGSRHLECPCHRGVFDLEGNVVEGPPPRPLTTFLVQVQNDRVIVRRRTAS